MHGGTGVRIVAGVVKGYHLLGPSGLARPTSGRVRKSLFDTLAGRVVERTVVDLCAGIGSLGIEALSRGAAFALFVDRDPRAVRTIRENLVRCRLADRGEVWCADAVRALHRLATQRRCVDLIVADPPYGSPIVDDLIRTVGDLPLLTADGLCIVEHSRRTPPSGDVPGLTVFLRRELGDAAFTVYQSNAQRQFPPTIVTRDADADS